MFWPLSLILSSSGVNKSTLISQKHKYILAVLFEPCALCNCENLSSAKLNLDFKDHSYFHRENNSTTCFGVVQTDIIKCQGCI